jgi:hypothetical protein
MVNVMVDKLAQALTEAIEDEYKARATYRRVIDVFGPVRPFSNILESEQRHIEALLPLFSKYSIPVPEDIWPDKVVVPESLVEACRLGVYAEIENAAMYDRLLAATDKWPDVQQVLLRLKQASQNNHLPAFRRCVGRRLTARCRE